MKIGKLILAGVTGVLLVGGLTTTASASSMKKGTPKVLRGTWYTKYHKMKQPKGYHRYQIRVKKHVAWMYDLIYNKHKKITTNTANFGIDKGLHYKKVTKNKYQVWGHAWNDTTTKHYTFTLSKHNKKVKVWQKTGHHNKYWDTFYK
ncbi:hypothetical protein [Levilactobacillus suantsaii]|uniref:Uncharacterized protein n=1 Tax=Levilactobacillus suantsaii TaxID=2292255 RepID=A0A4Q0VKL3_9LACO|nr:hypothetical protein [Levilactobacillus suantsaii]QMU08787.1 hypothetical protein H3M12_03770 [Levilactobacillus suantsaii]RXI78955.1 hypothetical protein DXH47_05455 [Levilactobacillus suantsaii]